MRQREVRDLPWRKYQAVVHVEYLRVRCPQCGLKVERVPQLPGKAPFSKDSEDAAGLACEAASARQVARQFGMPASTVGAIDLRYPERWAASRTKPVLLRQTGVDEIYPGETQKFLTVVSNPETGEPLWFGRERRNAGRVFRKNSVACGAVGSRRRAWTCGNRLRRAIKVGAGVRHRLCQVPGDAARQSGGG